MVEVKKISFITSDGVKIFANYYPNKESKFAGILIHQVLVPEPGIAGQAKDIEIAAKHLSDLKNRVNQILAFHTGKPLEVIEKDTDRDFWMNAEEAKEYGIIDKIIKKRGEVK